MDDRVALVGIAHSVEQSAYPVEPGAHALADVGVEVFD
jgi:hypothetical protein